MDFNGLNRCKFISQTQADPNGPKQTRQTSQTSRTSRTSQTRRIPPPVSPPFKGGFGRVLLQNQINQGGYVAHVDFAIAVDVARSVGIGAAAEDFVDEGSNVAHVNFAVAIDVA